MMQDREIPLPAEGFEKTNVGDVIQVTGATVPRALWKCWFKVESKTDDHRICLSRPYIDSTLTRPFEWVGSGHNSALALERRSKSHRA